MVSADVRLKPDLQTPKNMRCPYSLGQATCDSLLPANYTCRLNRYSTLIYTSVLGDIWHSQKQQQQQQQQQQQKQQPQ